MESITVILPKKMPLSIRISEAGMRLRDWLRTLEVKFDDEKYRLYLTAWDLTGGEFHYHYNLLKGRSSAAVKSGTGPGFGLEYGNGPASERPVEQLLTDLSPDY